MKRDADLVRRICLTMQDQPPGREIMELPGVDDETVAEHVRLLIDAGLVEGSVCPMLGAPPRWLVQRLTWAGQDFADAARSETLWHKAKESVLKPGALWTLDLLKEWLKAQVAQGFAPLG